MSLTSYRAAPPRAKPNAPRAKARVLRTRGSLRSAGPATTYSPAPWDAVPSALRRLTAEFEMGSGSGRLAQATGPAERKQRQAQPKRASPRRREPRSPGRKMVCLDPRTWITRAIKPIERLVPVGSTRRRACTPGLSTWSSSTALKGVLVSRKVSRLDAFSGYPVRT